MGDDVFAATATFDPTSSPYLADFDSDNESTMSNVTMAEARSLRSPALVRLCPSSQALLPYVSPTSMPSPTARVQSPTPRSRFPPDDLLSLLTPPSVLAALRAPPPGPLSQCLATAPLVEKELAQRAASASARVLDWLVEVSRWSWPAAGGPAGFEVPEGGSAGGGNGDGDGRHPAHERDFYRGSLSESEVARLDDRVAEICTRLEELELEDIKSRVLQNHTMPLSRPGTPMSAASSSTSSLPYRKMDDMTAVITAILVQALPNLARLTRLLWLWSMRLAVLRGIPGLFDALADAEAALRSGWTAISIVAGKPADEKQTAGVEGEMAKACRPGTDTLTRRDFDVMKRVLEKKVTAPGSKLDDMLDRLEGHPDTLPDAWLDRMEAVEMDYGRWVAAGERIIRWAREAAEAAEVPEVAVEKIVGKAAENTAQNRHRQPPSALASDSIATPDRPASTANPDQSSAEATDRLAFVATPDLPASTEPHLLPAPPLDNAAGIELTPGLSEHAKAAVANDVGALLPPITINARPRPGNAASETASAIRVTSGHDLSGEPPQTPRSPSLLNRPRIGQRPHTAGSSPSSPIRLGAGTAPSPGLAPAIPDDAFLPSTPLNSSFAEQEDDELSSDETDVGRRGSAKSPSDDYLRRQISEILESIPGTFKLSSDPRAANLNPPDLVLPRLRKPTSREPLRRSTSSLFCSRAPTPSYTLTPAPKNASHRRPSRGQPETRLYHLSHSSGGAPIKLFIRAVGETGERVMVRVGGGWADLGEYLKDYAAHHTRRGGNNKIEIRDLPGLAGTATGTMGSSPSRPNSSHGQSPMTPLHVRKKRRGSVLDHVTATPTRQPTQPNTPVAAPAAPAGSRPGSSFGSAAPPKTPVNNPIPARALDGPASAATTATNLATPSSGASSRSRASSPGWADEDGTASSVSGPTGALAVPPVPSIALGLAGPTGKKYEMSEESRAWVESVKERVRLASGERRAVSSGSTAPGYGPRPGSGAGTGTGTGTGTRDSDFGDIGRVGGTKRVFRRG